MNYLLVVLLFAFSVGVHAQTQTSLYNPAANAEKDIAEAIKKAKAEKKNVFIQAGGNWGSWCIEFNRFTHLDAEIDSLLRADFVVYHLNYSPENKNLSILAKYKFPQRFGFPVFLVLDENGSLIHSQNSAYLEQGRTYNKGKLIEFLKHWNHAAVDPANYRNY